MNDRLHSHIAAAFFTLGLMTTPWVAPGCEAPASPAPSATSDAPAPGADALKEAAVGAPSAPSAPSQAEPDDKPELPAEIVAKQDAIRARLTELVDDPTNDSFEDADTIAAEFPEVEFEMLFSVQGERAISVRIKGGETFDVLPASRRTSTRKK
jgi:hypothetical protein